MKTYDAPPLVVRMARAKELGFTRRQFHTMFNLLEVGSASAWVAIRAHDYMEGGKLTQASIAAIRVLRPVFFPGGEGTPSSHVRMLETIRNPVMQARATALQDHNVIEPL